MPKKSTKKTETKESLEVKKPKAEKKSLSDAEFEKKVIELAKTGLTSEKIGEALRKEGIHPKEHGKKISRILKEKDMYVNSDLENVENKLNRIKSHYEKNKQDKRALKDRERVFGKFRKLSTYFSR